VALIAGTGSLALGTDGLGGEVVVGGWGHALGDEGSGYDLGRRGVIAALRAADGRSVPTTLLPMLLAAWGIGEPADIVGRVYGTHPADLAAIAPLVFQAAWQGDRAAQRIVARGAAELARCALAAATKLRLPHGSLPLALAGSLLIRHPGYRNLVLAAIRRHRPLGTTVLVDDPALTAACWAAQAE
jgi:N-acetylglucosamine kinase-like BadF-type ATPase